MLYAVESADVCRLIFWADLLTLHSAMNVVH